MNVFRWSRWPPSCTSEFLRNRESLVVAGTHGKTTTTSMLAWIYEVAARSNPALAPSFLIGGVAENFGTSFRVAPTRPFILEGDEYDTAFFDKGPKFLHYFPMSPSSRTSSLTTPTSTPTSLPSKQPSNAWSTSSLAAAASLPSTAQRM